MHMPNQIQDEFNLARKKLLTTIQGTNLVELSLDNVAKVEAMICNDSAYLKAADKRAGPTSKYSGSTAYWMTKLKIFLEQNKQLKDIYNEIISNIVQAVDRDNSTHLNADGCGRREITDRISNILPEKLIKNLKEANLELINIISAKTSAKTRARVNLSFASKFCHYACFYLFEGLPEQDNYSIYDNVVKKVLPEYVHHYQLMKRNIDNYGEYQKTIDEIIAESKSHISRNGFDHLLWYYFKGRI